MVHEWSPWRTGPFVKINCPAIPESLLESELFGYEKGAFTHAYGAKPGRVELAHQGTLFLDEISELDFDLQAKLLQLLQEGKFCRIGGQEDQRVEVRIVCATNRHLPTEIENGTFRRDLFYRINVVNLVMSPLHERRCDIQDLAQYFLARYNRKYNCRAHAFSSRLITLLTEYHWPGNIRELQNLVKRYVIFGEEEVITGELAPRELHLFNPEINMDGPVSLKKITRQAVRELEHNVILKALQANKWNRKRVAEYLGISYRALLYKISDARFTAYCESQQVQKIDAKVAH
ncbi:MAG: sigma-54-dependent Fis family transcriptional regulator [Acidobacteriales bacterium]|nr:sigma-54-dependent Fis family transcriptional regulator [Terriglobales bacterium]